MTLDKIEEAATTYAIGLTDDVLKNSTPDFKQTFEHALRVAFMAGAHYVIKATVTALILLAFLITLADFAGAQSPVQPGQAKQIVLPKPSRFKLDWGDLAMGIGGVADIASSRGLHELNPALRNSQGGLSTTKAITFKLIVFGLKKTVQAFYPDHPKATMWFGVGVGVAWGAVAYHNTQVKAVKR